MTRVARASVLAVIAVVVPVAHAHQGSPNFESRITQAPPGLSVEVLNRDDRLRLRNETGKVVVVEGYDGEPYVRLQPDGRVELNVNSPAVALNSDRYAEVDVPESADAGKPPRWETARDRGAFEWHDHRIHWMARTTPPQVKDEDVRTKVFAWTVPITVGGRAQPVAGDLFWTPTGGGGPPLGAIIALAVLVALAGVLTLGTKRRRSRRGTEKEAW